MELTNLKVDKTNPYYTRFSDAPWANHRLLTTVGGVGGIGSWVALLLARTGQHEIHMYDMDTVENFNIAGQFYQTYQIGQRKIDVVANNIASFCGPGNLVRHEKFDEESPTTPIMFACFDNMKARKQMFESWLEDDDRELFIDGRMAMEFGEVYCVINTPESIEAYRKTLFNDEDVPDAPCSAKITTHNSTIIAGYMIACLNNYLSNIKLGIDIRELPRKLNYDLMTFSFNLE